jgi:hypothetical protein
MRQTAEPHGLLVRSSFIDDVSHTDYAEAGEPQAVPCNRYCGSQMKNAAYEAGS